MKKRNLQRIFAAFMATAMVVGVTACDKTDDNKDTNPTDAPVNTGTETTPEPTKPDNGGSGTVDTTPEPTPTEVVVPADLQNLGGMEIIIRDWWSPEDPGEPKTEYEEAQRAYQKEMMDKYNFTIRSMAISDWGSAPNDFVEYATNGGDDKNYVFVLRNDPAVVSAMASGLMYDLSKMPDVLDFSSEKFAQNRTHELYSYGSSIYCCFAGPSEPRDGIFFNKSVLKEAGINPDDIYDMQKNNTWTWEEFEKLLAKVQRDTDGDGQDDVFGLCCNNSVCVNAAVISNGGKYVGKDASGKFTYNLEDPETTEALNWIVDIFTKYNQHDIEGAAWNYYMDEFKSGVVGFMEDQEYQPTASGQFYETNFEMGFVMFPKGPKASTLLNRWDNNPHCIPACYGDERARKIAFAWNLYTNPVPGYEDYNGYVETAKNSNFDERAMDETVPMMSDPAHGLNTYYSVIPDLNAGPEFVWSVGPNADIAALQEQVRDTWKAYIDAANK